MITNSIKRPWQKKYKQGNRYNPDPFYNSSLWKSTRASFLLGTSILPNGSPVSNALCYDCMALDNKPVPMKELDHIIRIKDGGSRTDHSNLRSLCKHHHSIKSANEGNQRYKKG